MLHLRNYSIALFFVLTLLAPPVEARGRCDGFHGCRCGTTAARYNGLPYDYKGYNLKKASEYRRAFPHTSFQVKALAVWNHHVATIVGGDDCHSATVYDDAGTYQRNVCGATFVTVSGG